MATLTVQAQPIAGFYNANPDAKVLSIDTSGGIVCSRTSGQIPCFVQVSASAIAALGGEIENSSVEFRAYEDLHYSWDFGNPGGTETFTDPRPAGVGGGGTKNANSDQTGPEAAYCYRTAGTYTVTLTIRARNAYGVTQRKVTRDITVSAFSASGGTYYFDSVAGSDSNDGLSSGAPKQSLSALNTVSGTSDRQFFLKRGSEWAGSLVVGASRQRYTAYGTGNAPIVDNTVALSGGDWSSIRGRSTRDDIVFSGLNPKGSRTENVAVGVPAFDISLGTFSNIYIDNCHHEGYTGLDYGTSTVDNATTSCGFWNTILDGSTNTPFDGFGYSSFYCGPEEWFFFIGGSVSGNGGQGSSVQAHHIYPQVKEHGLYRWIAFPSGVTGKGFCLNLNYDEPEGSPLLFANYHLLSECNFTGAQFGFDLGTELNAYNEVRFRNTVVQNCAFHNLSSTTFMTAVESVTIRDGYVWDCGSQPYITADQSVADVKLKIYRMKMHRPNRANSGDPDIKIYRTNFTWGNPIQFVDNVFMDEGTSVIFMTLNATLHVSGSLNSLIDRNQYWHPNKTGTIFIDLASSGKTIAQWRALGFDVNGSVADPGWTDPANGDFS